jgi:hypothetical protein
VQSNKAFFCTQLHPGSKALLGISTLVVLKLDSTVPMELFIQKEIGTVFFDSVGVIWEAKLIVKINEE